MGKETKAARIWVMLKPFSVKIVKCERMIREIMVLKNAGQNFEWKGKEFVKKEFDQTLIEAENLANDFRFEKSWGHILNAETLLVSALDTNNESHLQMRAELILIESEKINSAWRIKQIKALLSTDLEHLKAIKRDNLLKAMAIRNDYYLTRSHKINLHNVNANILTFLMTLILAGIIIISFLWDITDATTMEGQNFPKMLVIAGIFGALGAGFSYGKTLFSYNPELSKVPDQLLSMTVTAFRFIIGASAAIIVLLLFRSKFLNDQFSKAIMESPITYIVFSFVAGFSERWVVKMLGLVTKEKEKE